MSRSLQIRALHRFGLFALAFGLVIGAASPLALAAGSRPFKGRVAATWDNIFNGLSPTGATFQGGGPVTHMGNTTQKGTLFLQPTIAPLVFRGSGTVTITAANGDDLILKYEGLLFAATGEGRGTFTLSGGTGRFANATGQGTFSALIDTSLPVNQPMTVELNGRITY